MTSNKFKILVVDSGAIIKESPLHELGENLYTIHEVFDEIKDMKVRSRLQCFPYNTINFKDPKTEDIKFICNFSRKTGDYFSLSLVDIKIMSLAYMLHKEMNPNDNLNTEPRSLLHVNKPSKSLDNNKLPGFYVPKEDISDKKQNTDKKEVIKDESDEDDDRDWITPKNVKELESSFSELDLDNENNDKTVACITSDNSMMNVLLQIGLKVISVDANKLIRQTKLFALRCFACFKVTNQMDRKFCPWCGNLNTLKKVSITYNNKGERTVHINFRKPINIRGMKYSLPLPKGGKHADDPIVVEDQPIPQNKASKITLMEKKILNYNSILSEPDYLARDSPFAHNDVYSSSSKFRIASRAVALSSKRNPNEVKKATGNRKKKKKTIY